MDEIPEKTKYHKAELFTYEHMNDLLSGIPDERERLFFMSFYANGLRVEEACRLVLADYNFDNEFLKIQSDVLKKKDDSIPKRNSPLSRSCEPWLTEEIIRLWIQFNGSPESKNKVWTMSKRTAQYRANKYFGTISHAMRHNRATHLMTKFNYSLLDLQQFFGLSPASMDDWRAIYGHLEKSHLEDKWRAMEVMP